MHRVRAFSEAAFKLTGPLIAAMIFLTVVAGLVPLLVPHADSGQGAQQTVTGQTVTASGWIDLRLWLHWAAGLFAASASLLLLPRVRQTQRWQVGVLCTIGVVLMVVAGFRGQIVNPLDAISVNTGLLTMIIAVGCLKLVVIDARLQPDVLPVGQKAFGQTLVSVAVFGSFINLSAPLVICDRIAESRPINQFTASSITRVFCACSAWSPFFGGFAVVMTHINGVNIVQVMAGGLPFLVASVAVVFSLGVLCNRQEVSGFTGYPLNLASLWIPAVLSLLVTVFSVLLPSVSILIVITVAALALTSVVLVVRHGGQDTQVLLRRYVAEQLPQSANELLLFLAAGILGAGLSAWLMTTDVALPFDSFTNVVAMQLLGAMIVIAALGIHPVIQIAGITPVMLIVSPAPELLALTYLLAWALGTCGSPLAGTHLAFQGRYHIPAWKSAVKNWGYVLFMYGIACGLLWTRPA